MAGRSCPGLGRKCGVISVFKDAFEAELNMAEACPSAGAGSMPELAEGGTFVWLRLRGVEESCLRVVELLAMEGRCPLLKRFRHGRPDRGR